MITRIVDFTTWILALCWVILYGGITILIMMDDFWFGVGFISIMIVLHLVFFVLLRWTSRGLEKSK